MMFVCYVIAFGILGLAYESPDLFILIVLLFLARTAFRSH